MRGLVIGLSVVLLAVLTEAQWTPSPYCPYPSETITRTPYEGDCTKWWECYEGARYVMTCPVGQEFSAKTLSCTTPADANCDKDATVIYPTYPYSTTVPYSPEPGWTPDPLCPYPSNEMVYFDDPYNCSQYYECYQGNKYLMDCPRGLWWHEAISECDYPTNVDCHQVGSTTTSAPWDPDPKCSSSSDETVYYTYPYNCSEYWECYQGKRYLMTCPGDLVWSDKDIQCEARNTVDCSTRTSPQPPTTTVSPAIDGCLNKPDGSFAIYPYDCSKYYKCVGGKGQLQQCSHDFYWNQEIQACDFPSNVDCTPLISTTSASWTPDPSCPYPTDTVSYIPYPYNCSKYWECVAGNKYLMNCPLDKYWNAVANKCDNYENVDCSNRVTTASPGWTPDPQCPYPSDNTYYYEYPYDCQKYWKCFEGNKYLMSCAEQYYWNDVTKSCDFLENVNCANRTSPGTPSASTTPASGIDVCSGHKDGSFAIYPYDCNKYYECVGGKGIVMTCQPGLYWNQDSSTCDYPSNVECNPISTVSS